MYDEFGNYIGDNGVKINIYKNRKNSRIIIYLT